MYNWYFSCISRVSHAFQWSPRYYFIRLTLPSAFQFVAKSAHGRPSTSSSPSKQKQIVKIGLALTIKTKNYAKIHTETHIAPMPPQSKQINIIFQRIKCWVSPARSLFLALSDAIWWDTYINKIEVQRGRRKMNILRQPKYMCFFSAIFFPIAASIVCLDCSAASLRRFSSPTPKSNKYCSGMYRSQLTVDGLKSAGTDKRWQVSMNKLNRFTFRFESFALKSATQKWFARIRLYAYRCVKHTHGTFAGTLCGTAYTYFCYAHEQRWMLRFDALPSNAEIHVKILSKKLCRRYLLHFVALYVRFFFQRSLYATAKMRYKFLRIRDLNNFVVQHSDVIPSMCWTQICWRSELITFTHSAVHLQRCTYTHTHLNRKLNIIVPKRFIRHLALWRVRIVSSLWVKKIFLPFRCFCLSIVPSPYL